MEILNKDYLCQVKVNKGYNITRGKKDFTVDIISSDIALIDKYLYAKLGVKFII